MTESDKLDKGPTEWAKVPAQGHQEQGVHELMYWITEVRNFKDEGTKELLTCDPGRLEQGARLQRAKTRSHALRIGLESRRVDGGGASPVKLRTRGSSIADQEQQRDGKDAVQSTEVEHHDLDGDEEIRQETLGGWTSQGRKKGRPKIRLLSRDKAIKGATRGRQTGEAQPCLARSLSTLSPRFVKGTTGIPSAVF